MKLDDKQIAAIRDGTDGVTPGPWALSKRSRYKQSIDGGAWSEFCRVVVRMEGNPDDEPAGLSNAAHIARCDPDTIRALATEVLESRALLDVDRLEEIITDSIDLDWTPRDAAKAIVRAMGGDGT